METKQYKTVVTSYELMQQCWLEDVEKRIEASVLESLLEVLTCKLVGLYKSVAQKNGGIQQQQKQPPQHVMQEQLQQVIQQQPPQHVMQEQLQVIQQQLQQQKILAHRNKKLLTDGYIMPSKINMPNTLQESIQTDNNEAVSTYIQNSIPANIQKPLPTNTQSTQHNFSFLNPTYSHNHPCQDDSSEPRKVNLGTDSGIVLYRNEEMNSITKQEKEVKTLTSSSEDDVFVGGHFEDELKMNERKFKNHDQDKKRTQSEVLRHSNRLSSKLGHYCSDQPLYTDMGYMKIKKTLISVESGFCSDNGVRL